MTLPRDVEPRVMGSQFLPEIERPFSYSTDLSLQGDALVINTDAVIGYRWARVGKILIVGRERTQPVVTRTDRDAFAFPYPNPEQLKGKFGTIFIEMRPDHVRLFYVGEDYRIIAEPSPEDVYLVIESTKPIRPSFTPGSRNYVEVLQRLNYQKSSTTAFT